MSTYAGISEVISDNSLNKLFPNEYKNLMTALKRKNETLNSFASELDFTNIDDIKKSKRYSNIFTAYTNLKTAFEAKFKKTTITLTYLNPDAECHDLQTEYYWSVDGIYQLSKSGKELQKATENDVKTITFVFFD